MPPQGGADEASNVPYRRLWAATFLGFSAVGMTIQVMPAYAHQQFGAGAVAAGLAVTVGALATMIARPLAGRIADQKGGRRVALGGALLGLAGAAGHIIAHTMGLLVVARLFLGAGEGALFTGSVGWILAHSDASKRGRIAGHFGLSMWMGLATGPVIATLIMKHGSYLQLWLAACSVPLVAVFLVASTRSDGTKGVQATARKRAFLPRPARVLGISGALSSIGYGVIAAFLIPRFETLHFAAQNYALSAFGTAFMVTRFLGSGLADRIGARRVLFLAFLIEALGLAALSAVQTELLAFASTAVAAAGLSLLIPSVTAWVAEAAGPHERTAAVGAVTSAWDLGVAVGGPLGGLFAGATNAGPFALASVAALLAIAPLAVAGRSSRPRGV